MLYDIVKRESNITLLLNCTCMNAQTQHGTYVDGRDTKILSVTGYQMTTQCLFEISASLFSDCSGDSILAPLTGAKFRMGREGKDEFSEDTPHGVYREKTAELQELLMNEDCSLPSKTRSIPPFAALPR